MSTHVAPELLEEAERLRTALREIEQATEGIPEQNCMIANRIARLALRDTAPAEGFFARGDDGQYRLDPAPTAPTEERHWQDDAEPSPGRAQAAYQAQREREKA